MGCRDFFELSTDAMQYVVIEERSIEPLRKKWKASKMTNLEYYIANISPECWVHYKARMPIDCIQPYSLPT